MSTYEYLLLDNYELGDSEFFIEKLKATPQANPIEVVGFKARSFLKHWVEDHRVAGVKARLGSEIQMFQYAATRCRRFFGIRFWHVAANKEVRRYRRWWLDALERQFDQLKADLS